LREVESGEGVFPSPDDYGVWGSLVSSPAAFGAEFQPEFNLVYFSHKIWLLVTFVYDGRKW